MKFIKLISLIAILVILQLRVGYAAHFPGTAATLGRETRVLNYYVQNSNLPWYVKQDVNNFGLDIEDLMACISSSGYNSEDPGVPVSCKAILEFAIQMYEVLGPLLGDLELPLPAVYSSYLRTRFALYTIRIVY